MRATASLLPILALGIVRSADSLQVPSPGSQCFDTGLNGTVDCLEQAPRRKVAKMPWLDALRAVSVNNTAWVVWLGDSNMRHTYYWWVTNNLKGGTLIQSEEFGLDRTDLPFGGRWSDQEAVVQFPDGFEVRASFRFLHGHVEEFRYKTTDFHIATLAGCPTDEELNATMVDDSHADSPGVVKPNKFAEWAGQHRTIIDFAEVKPALFAVLKKYQHRKPSAVVLTEGWAGVPDCERFEETLQMFSRSPDVKFVWAPIYVTNHQSVRHSCFAEKIQNATSAEGVLTSSPAAPNAMFVDMWDYASKLPETGGLVHISVGGEYMSAAVGRFEDALASLENGGPV